MGTTLVLKLIRAGFLRFLFTAESERPFFTDKALLGQVVGQQRAVRERARVRIISALKGREAEAHPPN